MVMAGTSIKKTFEGLCYILKPAPIKEKNQETLREEINWWSTGRKLIQDMGLLNKMFDYNNDKDMDDKVYNQLEKLFKEFPEDLVYERIFTASESAASIFLWVQGQKNMFITNKRVRPKKE